MASKLARIRSVSALSLANGSPGTLCMAKKVAVAMKKTVTRPCSSRFKL